MANNKQQPTTKQKSTEPIKKESVNQKMTSELYNQLRDKGYTKEQIKSAWSDTKTPKMTNELYNSLRDKGYTKEQIKAGQYSRENLMPWLTSKDASKTFSSWSKSANDFSTWSNSQPKDWAKWDPAQANKWADILTKNAQQANSILADLKKQGAKAGIEEYDAYQSYADYFTKAAQQLRNNNSSYNSYRDANMYKASDGNYYTYDDVLKMEESLKNEVSGMSSLNFRIKSGYGTNGAGLPNFGIEITGEGTKKREKQSELEAMQTWIGEKNKQKDQTSWYADNFRPNMDTGKFYENAVATKEQLEAQKAELEKSKPNLQMDYAKVDELGNVYDYDYAAYNDDLEKWNKANAAFYAQYDAAQRDYTYASDPNFRFYSAVKNANVNSPEAKAVIEEGKRRDGVYADFDSTKIGTEGRGSTAPLTFESWLDSFARGLSGSSVNPSSTGVALQQANAAMYAGYTQSKHADIGTWSEDKLNAYYFLRGMGDDAGADRLAQLTNEAIAQAGIQKELYDPLDKFQEDHPVLGTVAATGAAMVPLFTGIPEYLTYVDMYMVTGGDIDKSAMSLMPSNISSRMVGNAANMMNEWGTLPEGIPVIGGKGVGDAYQLGISILQSALSRNMSGGMQAATLAQFFGSAASNGIFEGLNRGLDPDKALLLGTMNGFAEAIGEVVSLEQIIKIKGSAGRRAIAKDILVQMGIEGSEEAFTTVMNTLADILVNADESELEIAVQTYMSQGKSREEAEKQAIKDWINGVAFDFVGGAISGGVSALGANIARNVGTYKGSTQYLMDLAEQTPEGSKSREMLPAIQDEYTKKSQRKKPNRQNISAWHGNQFAQQVADDLKNSNKDAAVKAIVGRLSELGETGDLNQKAQVMADALIDGMMGEEAGGWAMTPSADFSANATANMQQVMNELAEARENFSAADYARQNEKWTDEVMKGRFLDTDVLYGNRYATANYQYGRAVERNLNEHLTQITDLEQQISEAKKELGRTSPTDVAKRRQLNEEIRTAENALKSHRNAILEDGYNSYSENQKSASVKIEGQEYKVTGLTMQNGGDAQVKLEGSDGSTQTMSIDDERLPAAFRSLALKVKTLGDAAVPAFQYYKPGTDISAYVNRIQNIRAFASENISEDAFMNSKVVKALGSEALAEFLYSHGQELRTKAQAEISKKMSETKEAIKKAQKESKKKTGSTRGNVDTKNGIDIAGKHFDGIEGMELSETQQAVVRMIESLSDTLGINYVLFNGDARGVLGVYRPGGTIAVNINAGSYSNGKLVRSLAAETLSHELTHFIEQFAAEEYQALRDAVVEAAFNKDSELFNKRVQTALRNLPANTENPNDAAMREVVADACTTMLKNSKMVTELARQNMTAAQKVADFIDQTIEKIRSTIEKAFSESDPKYYRDEAKLIMDEFERIQKLWDAGLKAATENYNAQYQLAFSENDAPSIAESENQYQIWNDDLPQKKQYGFKLMNVDENGLPHAMFIDAANPYELGQWYTADSPKMENLIKLEPGYAYLVDENDVADMESRIPIRKEKGSFRGLPGKVAVNKATNEGKRWMVVDQYSDGSKSIHNVGINGSGGVSTFALRPGIHAVDIPSMAHIGSKSEGSKKIDTRRPNQAWFLIEYPVDMDYNQEAFSHQTKDIREHLPEKGWYSYQTNSGAEARQHWFITGGMRVIGMVSEADARRYAREHGFEEDLPWKMGKSYNESKHAIDLDKYIRDTDAKPTPSKSEMARRIAEGTTDQYQMSDEEIDSLLNKSQDFQKQANEYRQQQRDMERSPEYKALFDRVNKTKGAEQAAAIQEIAAWAQSSGYNDVVAKAKQAQADYEAASKEYYSALDYRDAQREQEAIAKSGLTPAEYFREQAVKEFGYTTSFSEAGYILPNGKMLNFSGEKGYHPGHRGQDHRGISAIYARSGSGFEPMNRFMQDGNIRIMAESPGIDLVTGVEPTKEQYAAIAKFVREYGMKNVYFNVDLTDENGRVIGNYEYEDNISPTKVIADIQYYFANGKMRDNAVSRFHDQYQVAEGEEITTYIKDGHKANGETVDFINEILDGNKKGETRTHKNLSRQWMGMAKDGYVYGRVRFGDPIEISRSSPEYKDAMIEGTEYDIKDGETKWYYPVLETEDFRDNPRPIKRNGNYGVYQRDQFQMADRAADDTTFESEERTKAWTDLRAENEILRDATERLNKEITKLASQRDKAKAQLKRTTTPETRLNDAKKLAREIVKMTQREAVTTREKQYNKEMVDELAERIKGVADYIVQAGDSIDYDHVLELASDIAQDIVNNAEAEIDDGGATKEMRDQMRAALKGRAIFVPQNVRADTLDWNDFKKRYKDVFTFRDNGLDIDIVYENLLKEIPGLLDPTINNPGDMLNEMAEKWDLLQARYENPFENYENETISHYMNLIIQSALDGTLRQVAPTYADRMNARIAALREQRDEAVQAARREGREKLEELRAIKNERIEEVRQEGIARKQEALAREREAKWAKAAEIKEEGRQRLAELRAEKNERIEAVRQYYQEMRERSTIRRQNGNTRTRIKKLINDLNTRLTHPTEKRYVPAELVKSTIDILDMIDLDSGRGGVKLMEKIAKLQQQYAKLKTDPTFAKYSYDDVVAENITKMAQIVGDTPLRSMSANQLEVVLETLQMIEHMIRTSINQKIHEENINLYESGKNAIKATNGVTTNSSKLLGNAADFYFTNTMRPDVVFDRFGGFAKDSEWIRLYNMLNNAQRYGMDLQMKFAQPFEELLKDKENLRKLTSANEEDLVDIGLKDENGEAIKVTRDFMLFVYMNLFNEDNIRHVMFGGITIPELKEYLSGKGDRGFGKGHRKAVGISERLSALNDAINNSTDVTEKARLIEEKDALLKEGMEYIDRLRSNIESKLTAYDKKWVKAWWKFNEMSSVAMNQTTFDVYGIKKFMVENYFPIITDKNYVDVPMENIIKDMSLENAGFTKERIHASTPIKMMGLADVINMQANRSAQYAAMMPAVRAFNRIWNTTLPGYSSSLRDTVNSKFGSTGVNFVQNLLSDLQGGRHGDFTIFDRLRGHMAQATLSLNPRVALAQTASFPTAAAELGWKPVMKALRRGGKKDQFISAADRELIAKWSSALWYRTKGATGDLADVKNMQQAAHKVMDKMGWAMNWIEFMDGATVGRLWYAAQYYVDEKNPTLRKGSDAYYEKVAEAFNRCIERTQPNYTTMQRPELLRNPNPLIRALSMFMTQRLQNQSIMYSAVMKYNKYKSDLATGKNGVTQSDVSEMRDRLINAATSQLVAGFTIAIFKALCDGLLHKWGKAYRDDDNELTVSSVCLEIMDMFAESIVSNVVGGSEVYSAVKSIITGDKYYGIELSGVSTFTNAISDFVSLAQKPSLKAAKKLGQDFCIFLGIPEANAEKIGMALWNWGKDIVTGNGFMESGVERTSAQNARLLIKAYENEDEKKIERFSGEFKDEDTMMDAVRQGIKDGYVAKKQTISKTEAVDLLVKAGMRRKDAEAKVQEWTCEIVTGIPFSKIKDEYMKGNITQARVIELLTKYGGRDRESAAKTARSYACEKDTGHPYNDLKEAYLEGEITRTQLTSALKKYGLMNSTDSDKKATYYDYLKTMPDSKISEQRAVTFMQSIKQTGVTAKAYEDMVLNVDADDSGGYSQKEVGGYIQTHSFTDDQISALWKAFGKTWKTDFWTWEVKTAADASGTGKGANNGNVSQAELGYYLAEQIRTGKMTIDQAEKYWSSLLTTSKKSFSQWAKSKRVKLK